MKNWLLFGGIALLLGVAAVMVKSARYGQVEPAAQRSTATAKQTPAPAQEHSHPHNGNSATGVKSVPAYLEVAPSRASLGPTLDPEKFTGLTRDAYRAVKQIPVTIAQLPCYCHCDEGFGHKSLYSCFEDDHAAHCDVCVREALLALSLEKDRKLTPAQIRDRIVAQYENQ
jgi:Protein of unknown function with PCYCGC motif